MKKIFQKIKLRRMKSEIINNLGEDTRAAWWVVLFSDGTFTTVYEKSDLLSLIERDHIRPIKEIYDKRDRIDLERKIVVDINEL